MRIINYPRVSYRRGTSTNITTSSETAITPHATNQLWHVMLGLTSLLDYVFVPHTYSPILDYVFEPQAYSPVLDYVFEPHTYSPKLDYVFVSHTYSPTLEYVIVATYIFTYIGLIVCSHILSHPYWTMCFCHIHIHPYCMLLFPTSSIQFSSFPSWGQSIDRAPTVDKVLISSAFTQSATRAFIGRPILELAALLRGIPPETPAGQTGDGPQKRWLPYLRWPQLYPQWLYPGKKKKKK